jgi:beta-glucosidase
MTFNEKIGMLHGNSKFTSAGVERLGIPELHMSDGPHGVREEISRDSWAAAGWTNDSCTYFPNGTALAATWNPELAKQGGTALGEEARWRGKDVLLGPGINIMRTPLNGRNFEYMGEDPYLVSQMCVPLIQGIQSGDVAACIKHYLGNNQETNRGTVNVEMSERALREIYLLGFKAAIEKGGVYTVMGAYNKFRGLWCCENPYLMTDILRKEMNFKGWLCLIGCCYTTVESAQAGLDLEMGPTALTIATILPIKF